MINHFFAPVTLFEIFVWIEKNIIYENCARRDYVVHQRMNANGLLLYDIFSWNKAKQGGEIFECGVKKHYYYLHTNGIVYSDYVLCAWWVSFVTPDSSSSLPACSMRVLPPPLLLINCLSCCLSGEPVPSPIPPPQVDPISIRVQASTCFFVGYKKKYSKLVEIDATVADWRNKSSKTSFFIFLYLQHK